MNTSPDSVYSATSLVTHLSEYWKSQIEQGVQNVNKHSDIEWLMEDIKRFMHALDDNAAITHTLNF